MKIDNIKMSSGDKIARAMKSKVGKTISFIIFSIFLFSLNNPIEGKILSVAFTYFFIFCCL